VYNTSVNVTRILVKPNTRRRQTYAQQPVSYKNGLTFLLIRMSERQQGGGDKFQRIKIWSEAPFGEEHVI